MGMVRAAWAVPEWTKKLIDDALGDEHELGRDERVELGNRPGHGGQDRIQDPAVRGHDQDGPGRADDQGRVDHVLGPLDERFPHLFISELARDPGEDSHGQENAADLVDATTLQIYSVAFISSSFF